MIIRRLFFLVPLLAAACFPDLTGAPCTTDANCPSGQYCGAGEAKCVLGSAPKITITTAELPRARTGERYEVTLDASGGAQPYSFAVARDSTLPRELELSSAGRIAGTPRTAGTLSFRVEVSDLRQRRATRDFTLGVEPALAQALVISTSTIPPALQGQAYSTRLAARGGRAPYAFSLTAGALPGGLALGLDGTLAGIPAAAGTFMLTVQARDADGAAASGDLSLVVVPGSAAHLAFTTAALPDATLHASYSASLSVTGGTPGFVFSASGALPPGLALSPDGRLSGSPAVKGTFLLHLSVTDSASVPQVAESDLSLFVADVSGAVTILTQVLPVARIGRSYSTVLSAARGSPPYVWSMVGGALPPGLALAPATGALTGSPTQPGNYSFLIRATDSGAPPVSADRLLKIQVIDPLVLESGSLPAGVVGRPYGTTLSASGGTPPYAWSVLRGALPSGLSLDPATGVISGVPSDTGTRAITFAVSDSGSAPQTAERDVSLTVLSAEAARLTIAPNALPDAVVGAAYGTSLSATGGTEPYTFHVVAGSLPAGLNLSSSGVLTGTPLSSGIGDFAFTVRAEDSASPAASGLKDVLLRVRPALAFIAQSLPSGEVGLTYSAQLPIAGGAPPYSIAILGTLPRGLSMSSASGQISGQPEAAGVFNVTVDVHDSATPPQTASGSLSITISSALELVTTMIPSGISGRAYAVALQARGGASPYDFAAAGALPPGIGISAGGSLAGSPTRAGSYNFTVRVQDARSAVVTRALTLVVLDPLSISTSTPLPEGFVGGAYQLALAASGGSGSLTWEVAPGGALPDGLSLSASGMLAGRPSAAGTSSFTVRVTDGGGPPQSDQRLFTLRVTTPLALVSASLPGGVQGIAYGGALQAGGGTPPYSFTVSGALPAGLVLDPTTGRISGTPTVSGTSTLLVTVTDAGAPPQSASGMVSLTILPPPPSITTVTLPDGVTGSSYSAQLIASGSAPPFAWSIAAGSGSLPQGVSLSSSGALTGQPVAAGTYNFTVQVRDSSPSPQTATRPLSIRIVNPLLITNGVLPAGQTNMAYTALLTGSGGTSPYAWSIIAGTLPPGVSLSSSQAMLFGNPTSAGTYMFIVQAADASSPALSTTMAFTVVITPTPAQALQITTPSPLPTASGGGYARTLHASGGTAPYSWRVDAGSLPPGFSLNASAGDITSNGNTTPGDYTFRVVVTDSSTPGGSASKWFLLHVRG